MKKLSLSLLLGATLVATIVPATASAQDVIPGCFPAMLPDVMSNHPIPDTIPVGNMGDRNGDGWLCYKVIERKHDKTAIVVYVDNHNRLDPIEL
jgi:hypothetical protein